jgi:hypothetical protein
MELFMPSKEDWEAMQKNISIIVGQIQSFAEILNDSSISGEHFPEYMSIDVAAKYLRCPVGRIKSMVYKQKILSTYHIDLTTTVYISKKEMDELRLRVITFKEVQQLRRK